MIIENFQSTLYDQIMNFSSCLKKQEELQALFSKCDCPEKTYLKLIELGKNLPAYPDKDKAACFLVPGCQSQLYLKSLFSKGKMFYQAASDALISAGLAFLLLKIYNDEPPEALLKCPPMIIKKLNLTAALSPSRSNGLQSLYLRMQQDALAALSNSPEH